MQRESVRALAQPPASTLARFLTTRPLTTRLHLGTAMFPEFARRNVWLHSALLVFSLGQSAALAQHSDVLVDVDRGQLTVNERLHLADFRGGITTEGDILEINNPGYATAGAHRLAPDSLLNFDIVGPLLFSDGHDWTVATPSTYFELTRPSIVDHSVSIGGQTDRESGFWLAQADGRGTMHTHIRFRLGREEGPPAVGVYAVQKVLTSPSYADSDPFLLVFNNGLNAPDFVRSVVAARQLLADRGFDCTGDGLLTVDDLACVSDVKQRDSVLRSIGSVAGDVDGDKRVDLSDFLAMSRNFGTDAPGYTSGNFDLVGNVGISDFLILSRNFGFDATRRASVVPEPAPDSIATTLVMGAVLWTLRRKKSRHEPRMR